MEERVRYKQLEPEERVTIASMKQQGLSGRAIARTLGRSACTVSRELLRNDSGEWGYTGAGGERVGALWLAVCGLLARKGSPQQIRYAASGLPG